MTNNQNRPMTALERRALFSKATPEVRMPTAPIRRPAPKARRNSVPHRSIR